MTQEEVRQAFVAFIQNLVPPGTVIGKVKEVNGETCTVTLEAEKQDLFHVRLRASVNGHESGIIVSPAVGSYVLVSSIESDGRSHYITSVSEIDGIVINGGKNRGMVKIDELEANLKALKEYVEAINTALPAAFTAIGSGSTANGGTGATSYQNAMSGKSIELEDMENTNIKH